MTVPLINANIMRIFFIFCSRKLSFSKIRKENLKQKLEACLISLKNIFEQVNAKMSVRPNKGNSLKRYRISVSLFAPVLVVKRKATLQNSVRM